MKRGLGLNKIRGTIHTCPTWSEATNMLQANGGARMCHIASRVVEDLISRLRGGLVEFGHWRHIFESPAHELTPLT